jgi:uncharacterized integral membrane protein
MTYLLIAAMLGAIVAANLLVTANPANAIPNAFILIGADMVVRDRLDDRWRRNRGIKMLGLVVAGALVAYFINDAAQAIAAASATAFALLLLADWAVYSRIRERPWLERANISNIVSGGVDSVAFPLFAELYGFSGLWDWRIVIGLWAAKVGGGLIWSFLLAPRMRERTA